MIDWTGIAGLAALVGILTAAALASAASTAPAARVFAVEDYGAVADNKTDSGPGIRKAIAAAKASGAPARVVLKAGVYRIAAETGQSQCLPIDGGVDLSVEGVKGRTELIVTDPAAGCFRLTDCRNTWIRGVTIDYDPLPFTQGKVTAVDADAGAFELDIQEGFPLLSEPYFLQAARQWGMPIEATERRPKSGGVDHIFMQSWSHLGGRKFRMVAVADQAWRVKGVSVGDRWVQLARLIGPGGVGVFQCVDCGVEDVTVMASPSCATAIVRSEGVVMRRLSVRFRPETDRLLTTDADGIHCAANRRGPTIEECFFEGMADDSVNIYCRPNNVLAVVSPDELDVSGGTEILVGDRLQVFNPRSGRLLAEEVKVLKVEGRRGRMRLKLDRPVEGVTAGTDFRTADTVCNLSASGEGYVIRNCTMRLHRRHGVLLRAGKGLVEGNRFENLSGLGVVVTNEPSWPEGPLARDVTIRNNTVVACGTIGYGQRAEGGLIQVRAARVNFQLAEGHGQRRIVIEGNKLVDPLRCGIYIGSAEDVKIVGNTIQATGAVEALEGAVGVRLDNCGKVLIDRLTFDDTRPHVAAAVQILDSVDPGSDGVTIRGLTAHIPPGAKDILDERKPDTAGK